MNKIKGFGSTCVHDPKLPKQNDPHVFPIYATSSFDFESIQQGIDIFSKKESGYIYSRFDNPTIQLVAEKIARLENHGGEQTAYGLLLSSGMAAISTLCLALLKPGDSILTQGNLYGGTTELFSQVLDPLKIGIQFTDLKDLGGLEQRLKMDPSIKMIYFETPANPNLACVDLKAVADLARANQRITVVDNTFCTPFIQQPLLFGVDYVLHSTTKYLNGHGTIVGGVIVSQKEDQMKGPVWQTMKRMGTNSNAFDAWMLNNGLKTLEIRMQRHCDNAEHIVAFLENHPKVKRVGYVGLPAHPDHFLAQRQMRRYGGMLTFELQGGLEAGMQFMDRLTFCHLAPTLGDVDTLVLHPASMSHRNVAREIREQHGITDGMIRISSGIENHTDILEDMEQALR